ncbi:MAG: DUF2894 domain-containing protein [Burkholderiales bacterium]|nr:DUF2894 domain-containing protein [Burkholderiales bacterium]
MNDAPWDPVAAVAALRTTGTTPHDAVRLHYLEALARRAQGYEGAVRNLLDDKLRQALARYQSVHSQPSRSPGDPLRRPGATAPCPTGSSGRVAQRLRLTRRLAQQPQNDAGRACRSG